MLTAKIGQGFERSSCVVMPTKRACVLDSGIGGKKLNVYHRSIECSFTDNSELLLSSCGASETEDL